MSAVVPVFPSEDVQVYWLMDDPPVAGAVQDTVSVVVPAALAPVTGAGDETDGAAGVSGTVVIVISSDPADDGLSPTLFEATTEND